MVTHHVEEIPVGFTHVLLVRDGDIVAAGPIAETLTAEHLSETFDLPIELSEEDGRFHARSVRAGRSAVAPS
jgi:iron complex transport system ATP-binding protein